MLVPQLQFFHVVDFPVVVQRLIPTVQTLRRTRGIPQLLLNTVIDVPVALVVQDIPVGTPRLIPMVSLTIVSPVLLRQGHRCPCCTGRAGHSCRDAEAIHARCVQRQVPWLRSAVAAHQQGRLHLHGFSVQQTVEIHLLPYTWWSMSLLRWSCEFHSCRW